MIKNVLIPEKIGKYYLFSKRVLGFYVDADCVCATQIYLKGSSVTAEKTFKEFIAKDEELSYEERVADVVTNILKRADRCDEIRTAMPSSQVIFKTLKLPFVNYEKIKMVVGYEVEPLLPFALDEGVVDFIITQHFPEEGSSEIIVAAAQKSSIAEHISFFEQAGVSPDVIGVDLFSLYGLYKKIPSYVAVNEGVALVDIGYKTTRVAFVYDGRLKAVRVLQKGFEDFISAISSVREFTVDEARDMIKTFGVTKQGDDKYQSALIPAVASFLSSIQFTLNLFASDDEQSISKFILSGVGANITGLNEFIVEKTGIPCQKFQVKELLAGKNIRTKNNLQLDTDGLVSLGVALPIEITDLFNLLPSHMVIERDISTLTRQLVVGVIFIFILFASLIIHSFLQISNLEDELNKSKQEVVETLKKRFPLISKSEADFDTVIEDADKAVTNKEDVWFPFSAQGQFLKYLLELHTLDKKGLGLDVERIDIDGREMTLKARVKDYDAVVALEKELRSSKLFKYNGSEQKTNFTMKIKLARNG